ncbi:RNA recognition motif-containing protein [Cyclospora cayetanensis]|uniref:RNA recognition motif-containing protein n=1 Tax=Cyclospora cayetanensis TaxID=88456 RepID=A0A1D3D2I4_9EIME|nr:RNA recognition motif-containing protein [Cyclospora cayetanensis]
MENGASGRLYVGSLPPHYTEKDVYREFEVCGPVLKVELKKASNGTGYAFIEFQDPRDARDAIEQMHGRPPAGDKDGAPLRVELPNNRRDVGRGGAGGGRMPTGVKRGDYILEVAGLPPTGSWQDLKDHFRVCGDVGYADVWGGGDPDAPRFGEEPSEREVSHFRPGEAHSGRRRRRPW